MNPQLSDEQKRLLILVSRYSKPSERRDEKETWIKKIPLLSLIYLGIQANIFTHYDFAPTLVEYNGKMQFANISTLYIIIFLHGIHEEIIISYIIKYHFSSSGPGPCVA